MVTTEVNVLSTPFVRKMWYFPAEIIRSPFELTVEKVSEEPAKKTWVDSPGWRVTLWNPNNRFNEFVPLTKAKKLLHLPLKSWSRKIIWKKPLNPVLVTFALK